MCVYIKRINSRILDFWFILIYFGDSVIMLMVTV